MLNGGFVVQNIELTADGEVSGTAGGRSHHDLHHQVIREEEVEGGN